MADSFIVRKTTGGSAIRGGDAFRGITAALADTESRVFVTDQVLRPFKRIAVSVESQLTQNLLSTLLFVIEVIPEGRQEWPDQIFSRPIPITLKTFLFDSVNTTLLGQDIIYTDPGKAPTYDWPNPNSPEYPLSLRTYLYRSDQTLLGQDIIYSDPGQVPVYDWPVPKGPVFSIELRTFLLSLVNKILKSQDIFTVGEIEAGRVGQTAGRWGPALDCAQQLAIRSAPGRLLELACDWVPCPSLSHGEGNRRWLLLMPNPNVRGYPRHNSLSPGETASSSTEVPVVEPSLDSRMWAAKAASAVTFTFDMASV